MFDFPDPMNIAFINERFYPLVGGSENQAFQLASSLIKNNIRVLVVTRRWVKRDNAFQRVDGIHIYRVGIPGKGLLGRVVFALSALWCLLRHRHEFDIIHVHGSFDMSFLGSITGYCTGKPVVSKIVGLQQYERIKQSIVSSVKISVLNHVNFIICVTRHIMDRIEDMGVDRRHLVLIRNFVDTGIFYPLKRDEKLVERKKRGCDADYCAVFLGRLVKTKGLDLLLDAWAMVLEKLPQARLLILGSGYLEPNSVEEEVMRIIETKKLGHSVTMKGETRESHAYLAMADVLVLPSKIEGLSNAVIEAMSCGIPVIAYNTCAIDEIITHAKNGFLINEYSSAVFAEWIVKIFSDPALRDTAGSNARETVMEMLSKDVVLQKYIQLYNTLCLR